MRMMIAGGGTGGHLFPGLAVAERWQVSGRGSVCFVGSRFGLEARIVPARGYPFYALPIYGARGRGMRGYVEFALQLPVALAQAWRAQREFRPDVVVGLGGYGSVPAVLIAWVRRVPVVLLEQNARPGWANRLLACFATRICTSFAASAAHFPAGKAVHTGNPVRAMHGMRSASERAGFRLLVLGGSQGARSINRAVVEAAAELMHAIPNLHIVHQSGPLDEEWVRASYQEKGVRAEVHAFIDDMAAAYARADLVLCRAGASTLAELAVAGKAAVLVPYPYAADDHQRLNAETWQQAGAAEMILDRELTASRLLEVVTRLARNPELRQTMSTRARSLARPQAAEEVARVCEEVGRKR